MPAKTYYIPEGTTEPQVFEIEIEDEDGVAQADDLTGLTPGLELTDKNGDAVTISDIGTVAWHDAANRKVKLTPLANGGTKDLSPYRARWTVSDGTSLWKVPNGRDPDLWYFVEP